MQYKKLYGAVAQGDNARLKETPARPFEHREGRSQRSRASETVESGLSGFGVAMRSVCLALAARMNNRNGNGKTE